VTIVVSEFLLSQFRPYWIGFASTHTCRLVCHPFQHIVKHRMCNLQGEDLSFHISDSHMCDAYLMHSSKPSLAFPTVSTLALNKMSLCDSRPSFAYKECEQVLPITHTSSMFYSSCSCRAES